jgi:hypothetical protein
MITTKNYESFDDPPDLPPFSEVQAKKKASLAEAIIEAALTFARLLTLQMFHRIKINL